MSFSAIQVAADAGAPMGVVCPLGSGCTIRIAETIRFIVPLLRYRIVVSFGARLCATCCTPMHVEHGLVGPTHLLDVGHLFRLLDVDQPVENANSSTKLDSFRRLVGLPYFFNDASTSCGSTSPTSST